MRDFSRPSQLISVNTRKDYHPNLKTYDKREAVLNCLKNSRCPMIWPEVQSWVMENIKLALTKGEIFFQFSKLRKQGLAGNTGKAFYYIHPKP